VSSKSKPESRFAGQLSQLAGRAVDVEQPSAPQVTQGDELETFSSHMTRGRKRRLKMAATREEKKIYEIVGSIVEEWLAKNHPDL